MRWTPHQIESIAHAVRLLAGVLAMSVVFSKADADAGIDYVGAVSEGLGYDAGVGLQLDADSRHEDLGWDVQAEFTSEAKSGASGYRYGGQAALRYYVLGDWAIEAGVDAGGYRAEFSDGTVWRKSGVSLLIGAALHVPGGVEVMVRYAAPDDSENTRSALSGGWESQCWRWRCSVRVERVSFEQQDESMNGTRVALEVGHRW